MGYTDTQKAAINRFRKKFSTNTRSEIDEKAGMPKPLSAGQKKMLEDLSQRLALMTMCSA